MLLTCQKNLIPSFVATCLVFFFSSGQVTAQWSANADSPLLFGEMDTFAGGLDHATTSTPDGATWIAWIDTYCLGNFWVQRIGPNGSLLKPGGMLVTTDPTCGFTEPPLITACSDNSVVVTRGATLSTAYRIGPDGNMVWGADGISIDQNEGNFSAIGGMFGLPNGDVFIAWYSGTTMQAQQFTTAGTPAWRQAGSIPTNTSVNRRIFSVVPDADGGAIVFWDSPISYEQLIWAVRFDQFGESVWDEPLLVVPFGFGSSLHTDPVAISDGVGGAYLAYTEGHEQMDIPSKLFIHHVTGDGTLSFAQPGVRASLDLSRQYEASLLRDEETGDLIVYWRDGGFDAQSLNAQRITSSGNRLWGDSGVVVTSLGVTTSHFDGNWNGETLVFGVSDTTLQNGTVSMHTEFEKMDWSAIRSRYRRKLTREEFTQH